MLRRILVILLALCVMLCAVFSTAFGSEDEDDWDTWDDEEEFDDEFSEEEEKVDFRTIAGFDTGEKFDFGPYQYQLSEDGQFAVVISYTGDETEVIVPEKMDEYPVAEIGDFSFQDNPVVESIVIPAGVQSIGRSAFKGCANLKKVELSEGVTVLQYGCFGGCVALESVTLPESLEIVEDFAFAVCPCLKELNFGSNLKSIGMQALAYCAALDKVTIPDEENVEIASDAFLNSPKAKVVNE